MLILVGLLFFSGPKTFITKQFYPFRMPGKFILICAHYHKSALALSVISINADLTERRSATTVERKIGLSTRHRQVHARQYLGI